MYGQPGQPSGQGGLSFDSFIGRPVFDPNAPPPGVRMSPLMFFRFHFDFE
jgi:hypothetical protein